MFDQSRLSKPQDSSSALEQKKIKNTKQGKKKQLFKKRKSRLWWKIAEPDVMTLLERHTTIVLNVNVLTEVCILVLPLTGFGNVLIQIRRLITACREMTSDTYKQQEAWKWSLSGSTASDSRWNKSKEFKELSGMPKVQRPGKVVCFFVF